MTIDKYRIKENKINEKYKLKLHRLRTEYVEQNKKYNIGDYISNITGIIKIESINYDICFNYIDIVYYGYRYKKINNELIRTKDKKISSLRESNSLKKYNKKTDM